MSSNNNSNKTFKDMINSDAIKRLSEQFENNQHRHLKNNRSSADNFDIGRLFGKRKSDIMPNISEGLKIKRNIYVNGENTNISYIEMYGVKYVPVNSLSSFLGYTCNSVDDGIHLEVK